MAPNVNEVYGGAFLKAADLKGQTVVCTIQSAEHGEVGDKQQIVLGFAGKDKKLGLNKTNANMIAELYGPETTSWMGKQIELYPTTTDFQGRVVDCIRVRLPRPAGVAEPVAPPLPAAPPVQGDDSIPF